MRALPSRFGSSAPAAFVAAAAVVTAASGVGACSSFEAASVPDGGGADAAAGPACGHDFCADFEGPLAAGWTAREGALEAVDAPDTGGKAVRARIDARPADSQDLAALTLEGPPTATGARVELDMRVERPVLAAEDQNFAALEIKDGTPEVAVVVYFFPDTQGRSRLYIDDGTRASLVRATGDIPYDAWTHVVLDVVFGGSATVSLTADGRSLHGSARTTAAASGGVRVTVGLQRYNGATPALQADYDNVRIDWKK